MSAVMQVIRRPVRSISPSLSLYADVVRFSAALVVLLSHLWPLAFPALKLPWPGHAAVVVFFVLSGLMISHSATRPGATAGDFALNRWARIWSVSIPALALSMLVALAGGGLGAAAPGMPDRHAGLAALALNVLPIGQLWSLDISVPVNAPFWSLDFEIWYYAIFGVFVFVRGPWRWFWTLTVAAIAGPKILLLLPVWLLGVCVHQYAPRLGRATAGTLFGATAVAIAGFILLGGGVAIRTGMVGLWPLWMAELHGANQFVGDFLLGVLAALHFAAAASFADLGTGLARVARPIRFAGANTFSLYLYHMPLAAGLVLLAGGATWWLIPTVIAAALLLAHWSERQLPLVRRAIERLWTGISRAPGHTVTVDPAGSSHAA